MDCDHSPVVPNVEPARDLAAVAAGGEAVAVAVRVARRLLLFVEKVAAQLRLGAVALLTEPRPLRLELEVPAGMPIW